MIIDRFHSNYIVEGTRIPSGAVQSRLDGIAERLLMGVIEPTLTRVLGDDSQVCVIRKINVDLDINLARLNDSSIADNWAARIISAVRDAVLDPVDAGNVIRFRSNADYLANFVADLLNGDAWQRWYYRGLEKPDGLGISGFVRRLLGGNREAAEDILLHLTEKNRLGSLLGQLEELDSKAIYEDCFGIGQKWQQAGRQELYGILRSTLDEISIDLQRDRFCSYKNYLHLYLKTLQKHPEVRSAGHLKQAVKLTFLLEECDRKGNLESVQSEVSLLLGEMDEKTEKEALLNMMKAARERIETTSEEKAITSYGGLFLLVGPILESSPHLIVKRGCFPEPAGVSGTNMFLLFLAQSLVYSDEFLFEGIDPGLLLFAGFESPPGARLLREYVGAITAETNAGFLELLLSSRSEGLQSLKRDSVEKLEVEDFEAMIAVTRGLVYKSFAGRLRRFEESSPEYIFKHFIHRPAEIVLTRGQIQVRLSRKPLDVVLRLSGLLEGVSQVPWLDNRALEFTLAG
jgi:hypothetical protein